MLFNGIIFLVQVQKRKSSEKSRKLMKFYLVLIDLKEWMSLNGLYWYCNINNLHYFGWVWNLVYPGGWWCLYDILKYWQWSGQHTRHPIPRQETYTYLFIMILQSWLIINHILPSMMNFHLDLYWHTIFGTGRKCLILDVILSLEHFLNC